MSALTCQTGTCPDLQRCLNAGSCEMANLPVITTAGPREPTPEVMQKHIDEYTLDDYRRGTDRAMAPLWRERPSC